MENRMGSQLLEFNYPIPYVLWGISTLVVILTLWAGFSLTGGPAHQRELKMDKQRENDLAAIESSLAKYYQLKRDLPESLDLRARKKVVLEWPAFCFNFFE